MNKTQKDQIISILDDVDDMTIATIRPDGFPQATTVSYMNDGLDIYFMTLSSAQKAQNISRNNKVSLTINRAYKTWEEIEGLSMAAVASVVTDPDEQQKIGAMLMEKFPQAINYDPPENEMANIAFFHVKPVVVSLLDYKISFGHTELINV